jgi:hypothetical protein
VYFTNYDPENSMTRRPRLDLDCTATLKKKSRSIIWTGPVAHMGDQARYTALQMRAKRHNTFYGIRMRALIVKIQESFNKCGTIYHKFLQLEHNNSDMFRSLVGHPQGVTSLFV